MRSESPTGAPSRQQDLDSNVMQPQAREEQEARAAWQAMCQLIDVIENGGRPSAMPPTIMPRGGEIQHGAMLVDLSAYCGMEVEYSTGGYGFGGGLLFVAAGMAAGAVRDANARRRAEAQSRAQWRPIGRLPAVITSQRLIVMIEGRWTTFHLTNLVSMQPDLANFVVILHFEGADPLMMRGPWIPWFVVVVSSILFGTPWPPGFVPPIPRRTTQVLPQVPPQVPPHRPALPPGPAPSAAPYAG
jgi:hypothetical protein